MPVAMALTGMPLNFAVSNDYNGGLPSGRIIEIFGPPSCGKTALLTNVMISAQKMGGVVAFNDHERAFSLSLAKNLGLDDSPGRWVYKKPRTYEDSLDTYVQLVRTIRNNGLPLEVPIVAGFDSLASMIPIFGCCAALPFIRRPARTSCRQA